MYAMTSVTIELPDDVAQSAQQAGLLTGNALAELVRELVRDRAARKLAQAIQTLDRQPVGAGELTPADIQRAIDAARRH